MAERRIYLVRHGQYNPENPIDEFENALTPLGIEQASLTAHRLKNFPITSIHTSDLRRAVETARIIGRPTASIEVQKTKKLREGIAHIPTGYEEVAAKYSLEQIKSERQQAEAAFDRFFRQARKEDKFDVIVCHGNLIRYFVCRVLNLEPEYWLHMGTYNCGISEIVIKKNGTMRLLSYNDTGHLPPRLITHNLQNK